MDTNFQPSSIKSSQIKLGLQTPVKPLIKVKATTRFNFNWVSAQLNFSLVQI